MSAHTENWSVTMVNRHALLESLRNPFYLSGSTSSRAKKLACNDELYAVALDFSSAWSSFVITIVNITSSVAIPGMRQAISLHRFVHTEVTIKHTCVIVTLVDPILVIFILKISSEERPFLAATDHYIKSSDVVIIKTWFLHYSVAN